MEAIVRSYNMDGFELRFFDSPASLAADIITKELALDFYQLKRIDFRHNDNVIDIGGHVGIFAIYLAKKYPLINIYSFEPIPDNYENFLKNLELNNISNVRVFNKAVSRDGRELAMAVHYTNTAGAGVVGHGVQWPEHRHYVVSSITLDSFLAEQNLGKCKLLKIDCEGSEYEILLHTKRLNSFEYLSGEFHMDGRLQNTDYSQEGLLKYCKQYVKPENIAVTFVTN